MDWEIYLAIGILALMMIGGFIAIFMTLAKKDNNNSGLRHEDYAELGKLQTKMDSLEDKLPELINTKMAQAQSQYLNKQMEVQQSISKELRESFKLITEDVSKRLETGFKTTNETFGKVHEQLGSIAKTQESLTSVSGEVNSLRRVLEGNQSRGQFGEYTLEMIIRSVFGDDVHDVYEIQKKLDNPMNKNIKPDVTIYLPEPDKHLCIDSKFPFSSYKELFDGGEATKPMLTKFKNEMMIHINKIRDDYIIPDVTAPYALMFIPSDGIFAYLHVNLFEVVETAYRDNVIIVAPSTLQPMLATINLLRLDRKRAESVSELNARINKLKFQFDKFTTEWDKLARSIRTTLDAVDQIDRRSRLLTRAFDQIKSIDQTDDANDDNADIEMEDTLP